MASLALRGVHRRHHQLGSGEHTHVVITQYRGHFGQRQRADFRPAIAFVAAADVDQHTLGAVQEYLLGLDDDPEMHHLLRKMGTPRYVEILEAVRALMAAAE